MEKDNSRMAITMNIVEPKRYRQSLLTVIQAAVQDEESLTNGFPSGIAICDCLDIVGFLEEKGANNEED